MTALTAQEARTVEKNSTLAFVYHEAVPDGRADTKLPSKDQAHLIAANVAKLPELLRKVYRGKRR